MKKLLLLHILFFTCSLLLAQSQYTTGLDLDDPYYDKVEELQADGSKINLPAEASLYAYCPFPRNQGRAQSCVGWATGYSALSIEKAIQYQLKSRKRITDYAFSALYVYNQIKEGDCMRAGSRISDALNLLEQKGNVLAAQFDHNVEDCSRQVSPDLDQYAARFRISDHLKLFPVNEAADQKIFKVKYALSKKKPVIIGMKIRRNFFQLNNKAQFWWPEIGDRTPAGGHAMTVVAYDDRRQAFLLMNSWGPQWGLGGFIWVKYDVFAAYCKYAYIIQIENALDDFWADAMEPTTQAAMPEPIPQNQASQIRARKKPIPPPRPTMKPLRRMAGQFHFKYNPQINQYSSLFEDAKVQSRGFYYQLQKKDWQVGQQFQLSVDNLQRNSYVYVFSVNHSGQVYIHWPRRGQQLSALQLEDKNNIIIPGKNRALKITSPGKDYLVILFSKKPLRGLHNLLAQLEGAREDLPNRIVQTLGDFMVPLSDISYHPNQVAFQVNTRSNGMVVPLILEVNSVGF